MANDIGSNLVAALEAAGCYKTRPYSGRAMYGRQCVGVVLDRGTSLVRLGAALAEEMGLRQFEDIGDERTDSMGMDVVVYWPSVDWPDDEGTGDDDEAT